MEIKHIAPMKDLIDHTINMNCLCGPKLLVQPKGISVIHKAWDKRELITEVKKIINNGV